MRASAAARTVATSADNSAILVALVPCFALTVVLGLLSDGVYHDDDLTHFLMARWAYQFPEYLVHLWGRPGLTVPLAAVAWFGDADHAWHAARVLSAAVTAATALLAARLAARLGLRNAWLVVLACYAQPLNTLLAYTTLTENFAAFYLVAAVSLLYGRRPIAASAVFSMVLLTRHEAVVFLPVWWVALVARQAPTNRRIVACLLSLWGPAAHNLVFWLVFDRWPVSILFQPHGSTEYPALGLLGYVPHALIAVPPAMAGLALVGTMAFLRRGRLLIPSLAGLFLLTHVAIKALGVFASGGYGRFMVVVTPFVAILAVVGLNEMAARVRNRRPAGVQWFAVGVVWLIGLAAFAAEWRAGRIFVRDVRLVWGLCLVVGTVIAVLIAAWATSRRGRGRFATKLAVFALGLTCAIQWAYVVRPLELNRGAAQVRQVVGWLRHEGLCDQPVFATNPWFAYFLELVEHPRAHKDATLLASMPVGTIFIWDSIYSESDFHRLRLDSFLADGSYQLLRTFPSDGTTTGLDTSTGANAAALGCGVKLYVFRKVAETPLPHVSGASYPADLMSAEEPFLGLYYIRASEGEP